ncbi:MAG: FliI/YscN family ATPase [Syntrophobacteraceae bacterium]|jgi:flagellum-specific ATP synthase|nr:FliI/YscN family ATPase [Syntrophobacteraceae bacterium]
MNQSSTAHDYLRLTALGSRLDQAPPWEKFGKVVQMVGNIIEAEGIRAAVGDVCRILPGGPEAPILAEVVGFNHRRLKLSPLSAIQGIQPGCLVQPHRQSGTISVGEGMLGRVLDGLGQPIDDGGPLPPGIPYSLSGKIANPLERPLIDEQLDLGIRCINGLLPVGKGQRIGIFAGSGVGKSTLLGMMARYTTADVNVIALVGERGREVNEFLHNELGPEGVKRSIVIVATSDQPATVRMKAAFMACAVAEYFRDRNLDVLLMMDSVTRFAMAAREVGLSAGEPPTTKGYTPSVFSQLPRLLERAGNFERGSITGIYTVLVDGGDMDDPVADSVRSILDGHIVLSRRLAQDRHYPSIDVLQSVSRLTSRLLDEEARNLSSRLIQTLALYKSSEDMIRIGAYVKGSHHETDYAISMIDGINAFLRQPVEDYASVEDARQALKNLFD